MLTANTETVATEDSLAGDAWWDLLLSLRLTPEKQALVDHHGGPVGYVRWLRESDDIRQKC